MKIYFARPSFSSLQDFEIDVLKQIHEEFKSTSCVDQYQLSSTPEEADLILFMESPTWKPQSHIGNLFREPLLQRYADKLLTYNYQDGAAGFLDGIYVHTEKQRYMEKQHKAWSTLWPHNEVIYSVKDAEIQEASAEHFCTFRGSISSSFRKQIVEHYQNKTDSKISISLVNRWYNHALDEKRSYIEEILHSQFILCPRGVCSYTPRFFETMALGRVPVLLADDWVPPENLDIDSVAIRVRERDFADLEEIIRSRESDAVEMGLNGRKYWKTYFSKEVRLKSLIDLAVSCLQQRERVPTLEDYAERWHSFSFSWANGWTPIQRARAKVLKIIRPYR